MIELKKIGIYTYLNDIQISRWYTENNKTIIENRAGVYTINSAQITLPFITHEYDVIFKRKSNDGKTINQRRKIGAKSQFVRKKYKTLNPKQKLMRRYLGIAECGAKYRNINFSPDITIEFSLQLLNEQNYKCTISGISISLEDKTASLDRIDSNKDYTKENVQWVHKRINLMKGILSTEEFNKWIDTIYQYNHQHNLS